MTKVKDHQVAEGQEAEGQEIRCPGCGRFLGFHAIIRGIVRLLCPNCKQWLTLDIRDAPLTDARGHR